MGGVRQARRWLCPPRGLCVLRRGPRKGLRPGPGSTALLTQRLCDPALNPNLKPHVEVDEEDADRELAKLMRAAKIQFQDLDEVISCNVRPDKQCLCVCACVCTYIYTYIFQDLDEVTPGTTGTLTLTLTLTLIEHRP